MPTCHAEAVTMAQEQACEEVATFWLVLIPSRVLHDDGSCQGKAVPVDSPKYV